MTNITVIMPTLPRRKDMFMRQCDIIKSFDSEIIILTDNCTEKSIGRKRGELLETVRTEYVMHIDDDDILDSSIFYEIKQRLKSSPDAVAFKEAQYHHGKFVSIASLGCNDGTPKEMGIVHRNPVKTNLAQKIGFYDINLREDTYFGLELGFILNHIEVIDKVLYHYLDNKDIKRNFAENNWAQAVGNPMVLGPKCENFFDIKKYGKIKTTA